MPKKGRKGVEQRVKGNVKAASSGRMADLLGGEMTGGVIGFEAMSRGLEGDEEEVSHGAGARFQVVMKQLGKRDTTTKIKALKEFASLCDEEVAETVVAILNVWTLMYNKLSTDNDNRVREASHRAMQACVIKIKNSMAPHLRSVLGSWVAGMCDPYVSAASAAQTAFSASFSTEKQTNVLKFGFKSIITFVEDITLKQSQDTFSDPKVVAADERLQRYERVVTMSLHGLSLVIHRLPVEFLHEKREEWETFLSEKRVWKLTRHNNPYIRTSCIKLVVCLCQCCPEFVTSHAKLFCTLVLSSLGEKDPGVMGPLWDAVRLILTLCQDWSDHVNVPKALLPGLWQLLGEGGHGSAKQIYPHLLPLLIELVKKVYPSDMNFSSSYLEKLKGGLQADRVRSSVSETEAVLQSFGQCLSHLLLAVDTSSFSDSETQQFYHQLLGTVIELVDYSLTHSSKTQNNIVCSWISRILDDLLEIGLSHSWIEQYLQGWLKMQLTEKLSSLLRGVSDKAHFTKIGSLLKSLGTHYSKPDTDRKVTFGEATTSPLHMESSKQSLVQEVEEEVMEKMQSLNGEGPSLEGKKEEEQREITKPNKSSDDILKRRLEFLSPALAGVCGQCISSIVKKQSLEHSSLLCTVLDLYGEPDTVRTIYRDRQTIALLSDSSSAIEERDGLDEGEKTDRDESKSEETDKIEDVGSLTEIVTSLCQSLLTAMDQSLISGRDPRLIEGVVSSVLLLLQTDGVSLEAVCSTLHRMVQDDSSILLLLLTKLGGGERKRNDWVGMLLKRHTSLLMELVRGGSGGVGKEDGLKGKDVFLWPFLNAALSTPGYFDDEREIKRGVMEVVSGVIQRRLGLKNKGEKKGGAENRRDNARLNQTLLKLLQTLGQATGSVIEDYFMSRGDDGLALLHCILQWCLDNCTTEDEGLTASAPLVGAVCSCYSHIVSLLPEPVGYFESTAHLIISLLSTDLDKVIGMAVMVDLLHYAALTSHGHFWSLYRPLLPSTRKVAVIPYKALERFCWKHLYSPPTLDLTSESVTTTISECHVTTLYLAAALCQSSSLTQVLTSLGIKSSLEALVANKEGTTNLDIAFPVNESAQERSNCYDLWQKTVCETLLAICTLQSASTHIEGAIVQVLNSALRQCLILGSREHHQWNSKLLKQLIERASMDNPLWCLALHQFVSALESSVDEEDRNNLIPELVSIVLCDAEPAPVLAVIGGLSDNVRREIKDRLMSCVRRRESDICLLNVSVHLFPDMKSDILSLTSRALSSIASLHSNSQITLFESLEESVKDPMVLSILDVISLLCPEGGIPSDAWDFTLCAMVTITHLVSEATPTQRDSVNFTVFYCKAMELCRDLTLYLSSSSPPEQQATEWRDFFLPDIKSCLLPAFLHYSSSAESKHGSPCVTLQCYYLCRAVAEVFSEDLAVDEMPVSLVSLTDFLFSHLHTLRITGFLLAKRLVSGLQFTVEGAGTADSQGKDVAARTLTIPEVRGLLNAAMERVDIESTFTGEDEEEEESKNTVSYLLLCLLIIEIMSQCGPEARASIGEWVKERGLVPHLLHGLFTVLSDSSSSSSIKTQLEVTLKPDLRTLCSVVYCAVAHHLPSMLRQWYLSVDRFTSSTVTAFTTKHVSPALQKMELEAVGKTATPTEHGNMEVKAYTSVSEVSVVYRLHEFSIELFVKLPTNYPLQPPTIREGKRVKVEASQWRKWMLQLNVFIANQNGTLMDGLMLWKSNLDKHFSGIDDCMICFSVIHGSLYSLPKMTCRTCKKKFHSACLYKWFSTSNKSSCPLCRNIF